MNTNSKGNRKHLLWHIQAFPHLLIIYTRAMTASLHRTLMRLCSRRRHGFRNSIVKATAQPKRTVSTWSFQSASQKRAHVGGSDVCSFFPSFPVQSPSFGVSLQEGGCIRVGTLHGDRECSSTALMRKKKRKEKRKLGRRSKNLNPSEASFK